VALEKAVEDRPEIREAQALENMRRKTIEIAKAEGRPAVYASWDYFGTSSQPSAAGFTNRWKDYSVAGITFSWPFFDGGATKAKVEQAIVDLRTAYFFKEKVEQGIVLELKTVYLSYKEALERIRAAESQLDVYRDNLKVSREKFRQGHISTLDLNDAVVKYDVSVFNRISAVYDYVIARSQFDRARGEM
jgi:outer membrane protein TolC